MTAAHASFVDFALMRWQEFIAAPRFSGVQWQVKLDRTRGTGAIEFWCESYLGTVLVWNNANCLDIDLMRTDDKSISILSAGPCTDNATVDARLEALTPFLVDARPGDPIARSAMDRGTTPNKSLERTRER
jgi:hypothetical protein